MANNKLPFDYRTNAAIYLSAFVTGSVQIDSTEDVVIDATIFGTIITSGFCEITENGNFEGDIHARTLQVFGVTNGEHSANDAIQIKRSAKIRGLYTSPTIHIEPGSIVNARIHHRANTDTGPL
ncbi:polymer-forming cytoskeletal protein [Patescibacteria group bacterium]|nr:MAG: polymer-forming cytoskeletal protein [Patescibacteria group bacterium]